MKNLLVLIFTILISTSFYGQYTVVDTVIVTTNIPVQNELPSKIILANGKEISYKKWCRQYDRASRKGIRRIRRKMKKDL
jgi:hypothetical protein